MGGLLILLGVGGAIFYALLVGVVVWTLGHPSRRTYASAVARGMPGEPSELEGPRAYEAWSFRSRGVELPVWDVRGDRAGDGRGGPTIVVTHGWGDSRIGGLARMGVLAPLARRVVLWDAPGHGEASGRCSMGVGEVEDLLALLARLGDEAAPVVLYGWSMGAGVSIAAAARDRRVAGVIAEAPYRLPLTPARNVMRLNHLPYRLNLPVAMGLVGLRLGVGAGWRRGQDGVGFDRAAHAARLGCPLLVIHGSEDEISPIEDGRAIASAAPAGEIVEVEGAGHNDLWAEEGWVEVCAGAMRGFVGRVGG